MQRPAGEKMRLPAERHGVEALTQQAAIQSVSTLYIICFINLLGVRDAPATGKAHPPTRICLSLENNWAPTKLDCLWSAEAITAHYLGVALG